MLARFPRVVAIYCCKTYQPQIATLVSFTDVQFGQGSAGPALSAPLGISWVTWDPLKALSLTSLAVDAGTSVETVSWNLSVTSPCGLGVFTTSCLGSKGECPQSQAEALLTSPWESDSSTSSALYLLATGY